MKPFLVKPFRPPLNSFRWAVAKPPQPLSLEGLGLFSTVRSQPPFACSDLK
ncbi:hypothetical protein JCM9140_3584 [Halalkalibacter wakoensis JCM 9140]|uniref:Uncharacterized protein n=1 Tax=Halalkalibacter wakoensis JCM 9140 TaxID=1236970 RepID=W4Q634_9BACI|nr:hypothetical protein JCM9140_3584 [Halalkalibacter wakoensis JCM 9140]